MLDMLEKSGLAWPNPDMWLETPLTAIMPVPTYPGKCLEGHTHSPRHQKKRYKSASFHNSPSTEKFTVDYEQRGHRQQIPYQHGNIRLSNYTYSESAAPTPSGSNQVWAMDSVGVDARGVRFQRQSSTDTSMPDYVSSSSSNGNNLTCYHQSSGSQDERENLGLLHAEEITSTSPKKPAIHVSTQGKVTSHHLKPSHICRRTNTAVFII
jgi:hypothetical protein